VLKCSETNPLILTHHFIDNRFIERRPSAEALLDEECKALIVCHLEHLDHVLVVPVNSVDAALESLIKLSSILLIVYRRSRMKLSKFLQGQQHLLSLKALTFMRHTVTFALGKSEMLASLAHMT